MWAQKQPPTTFDFGLALKKMPHAQHLQKKNVAEKPSKSGAK
jgi:hypothetical protein